MSRVSIAILALILSRPSYCVSDEPRAPRASLYVPLKFDGNPIRVIVRTQERPPRSVRWAVGELDTTLQMQRTIEDLERLAPPETPSEAIDDAIDELLRSQRPALHYEIHNGVPKWKSWNHKVDRRNPVDVVLYGTQQGLEGESESWVGVEVTVRPYGKDVLAELKPYYTEFEEAKGRRRSGVEEITFFGPPRRRGKMVRKPADIEILKKAASLKFEGDDEQSAETDPNSAKRQWASLLVMQLGIIELQRGLPLRFSIGEETLEATIESK